MDCVRKKINNCVLFIGYLHMTLLAVMHAVMSLFRLIMYFTYTLISDSVDSN